MDISITDSSSSDIILLDSSHRYKDKEGFLIIKDNPIACAGVFPFTKAQISDAYPPEEANEIVPVYRSEQSLKDAINMFKNKPIVYHHKWVGKGGETQQADGSIGSEVTYKNGALHADLIIYNDHLIKAIEMGTCKQLSPGYNAKIVKDNGIYDNTVYTHSITYTGVNHLGVVEHGRAGSKLTILDEDNNMGSQNASTFNRHSKRTNHHASSFVKVGKTTDAKESKETLQAQKEFKKPNYTLYKQATEQLKRGELNDSDIQSIKKQMDVNIMKRRMIGLQKKLDSLERVQAEHSKYSKRQRDAELALQTITKYIPTWVRKANTDANTNYRNAYMYLTKERLPDSLDARTAFITLCQSRKPKDLKTLKDQAVDTTPDKFKFIQDLYNSRISKQIRINSMIRKGA